MLFAGGGILPNLAFVASLTRQLHQAHWVYHDLMQNPRAYVLPRRWIGNRFAGRAAAG